MTPEASEEKAARHKATKQLLRAARRGNLADAQKAIDAGADVEALDKKGNTPLHLAAEQYIDVAGGWLPENGNWADVARLLLDSGAYIDALNDRGETPLHVAADRDDAKVGLLLVERGANCNLKNPEGITPRDLAFDSGCGELADVIDAHTKSRKRGHADKVRDRNDAPGVGR